MPAALAFVTAGLDLRERLLLLEAVEDLLAAALDAEHDRPAARLRQLREEVLRDRVDAALEPHLIGILGRDEAVADRLDALGLEEEVVVDEVDRAVAVLAELFELRRRRAPGSARATCPR